MSPANQSTYGQPHEGKYVAYVRVSTNKQDTERDEKDIRDFLGNKIENVTWYKENISGKVHPDNRPILQQAMQPTLRKGISKTKSYNNYILNFSFM